MKPDSQKKVCLWLGVSLPIILAVLFFMAVSIPKLLVADPEFSFIYMKSEWRSNATSEVQFKHRIANGKLTIQAKKADKNTSKYRTYYIFYIFDKKTLSSREISLSIPDDSAFEKNKWLNLEVPELQKVKLNTDETAPDGYKFTPPSRAGVYSPLSMFWNVDTHTILYKKGRIVKVSYDETSYFESPTFIGWILPE